MQPMKHPASTSTGKCLFASKRQTETNAASEIDAKVNHFNLTQSAKIVAAQNAPTECPDGNEVLLLISSGRGSLTIALSVYADTMHSANDAEYGTKIIGLFFTAAMA